MCYENAGGDKHLGLPPPDLLLPNGKMRLLQIYITHHINDRSLIMVSCNNLMFKALQSA